MKRKTMIAVVLILLGLSSSGLGITMYFNDLGSYRMAYRDMERSRREFELLAQNGQSESERQIAFQSFTDDANHVRASKRSMRQSWILTAPGLLLLIAGGFVWQSQRTRPNSLHPHAD